jgi:nucleoside-diphosphate-sugar epimerase
MARVVVLGAAGFLGSHLVDNLLQRGDSVVGVDDLSSGSRSNLAHLTSNASFEFVEANISESVPVEGKIDAVLNFASLASPPRYFERQLHTLRTGSQGTDNALRLATENEARFIMASTSEVYGDPEVHPQVESYRGSVNPIGPRSCYDEAKRYAEALCMAYKREHATNIGIVRIFNTYGPRLDRNDGRVVSNFICQALTGDPITIYGDGTQTRSFCYVDDEVDGIMRLLDSDEVGPINIGNPGEFTMRELADLVLEITGSESQVTYQPLPEDDPTQRCPDISKARDLLGWSPKIDLRQGLERTIRWFNSAN